MKYEAFYTEDINSKMERGKPFYIEQCNHTPTTIFFYGFSNDFSATPAGAEVAKFKVYPKQTNK